MLGQILWLEGAEEIQSIDGVHDLYSRLFRHVLNRVHRVTEDGNTESTDRVARDKLERMLEEVAVAAWHGGTDRAIPLSAAEARLERAGLSDQLSRIAEKRDDALTALLDSFFCRARNGGEFRSFEFTHKSFGQFLTARRIVRLIADCHRKLGDDADRTDRLDCLRRWLDLCGRGVMDLDLLNFLRAETAKPCLRDSTGSAADWRPTLIRLFRDCTDGGMPLPGSEELRAREVERRIRSAGRPQRIRTRGTTR